MTASGAHCAKDGGGQMNKVCGRDPVFARAKIRLPPKQTSRSTRIATLFPPFTL